MPGINLSRSTEQASIKEQHSFGRGAISIIGVLLLLLAAWFGTDFYGRQLSSEIDAIDREISSKRNVFSGADVDDVADIQFRINILESALKRPIPPIVTLRAVETLLLPGIKLTKYAFDAELNTVSFSGEADTLGVLAKQMVLVKRIPDFSELSVNTIGQKEKSNAFTFEFSARLSQ